MNTITCQGCGRGVPRGHAHLRSRSFVQIGWCHPCWTLHSVVSVVVPQQRRAFETAARLSA
jgi:hypothetical protein